MARKREERDNPNSCWNRAGEEEMIFVLQGHSAGSPETVRDWCERRIRLGKNAPDDTQITEAEQCAQTMEQEGALHKPCASSPAADELATILAAIDGCSSGLPAFAPGTAKVPAMSEREGAVLAVKVIDLLEEIDNTLQALKANGLEQHHADLHRRVDPVWRALDPILANGPECVHELGG